MQQKLINKLNVSSKILILFLILCTLLVSKSIFLIMFITVLIIFILVLSEKNVKLYVDTLKESIFWLFFFGIVYIIIFRDILGLIVFLYKMMIIIVLIVNFMESLSLDKLADGIYSLIEPLIIVFPNLKQTAYEIAYYIYFGWLLINSGNKIKKLQLLKNRQQVNLKYYLLPRLFFATSGIKKIDDSLKLSFYKVKKENKNFVSLALVLLFVILCITAVFKEVIL